MRAKVLYHVAPSWRVGEERELKPDLAALADSYVALADADRYPDDYAGRVISVVPESHEFSPGDVADPRRRVISLDLTDEEHADVGSRRLKVGPFGLEPVQFRDRWGAVGAAMRERDIDPEAWEREEREAVEAADAANRAEETRYELEQAAFRIAREEYAKELVAFDQALGLEPPAPPERPRPPVLTLRESAFELEAVKLRRSLPKVVTHTGAGLYKVDSSGTTHNDTIAAFDDNLLLESERFGESGTWTQGASPVITDDTDDSPNGDQTADTVGDENATGYSVIYQDSTVPDDSNWVYGSVYVKKDSDTSRFPEFRLEFRDGAVEQRILEQLNTSTGVSVTRSSAGTVSSNVTDAGDYWRLELGVKNNGTGNVTARFNVYPAMTTTWNAAEVAATGSIVAWGAQIDLLALSAYKPTRSATDTSVTLTTGGLTDGDRDGEVFVSGGNGYAVIRNGTDSVLVAGDATGEAGACTVSPYSTIQSALDQLWTDQGSATFTASQYIRIFAGTYDEVVVANAAFDPDKTNGFLLVLEGDPADDRTNIVVTYTGGAATAVLTSSCDYTMVRHLKVVSVAAQATVGIYGWVGVVAFDVHDCVVETSNVNSRGVYVWQTLRLSNTTITSALGHGVEVGFARDSSVLNCSITAARIVVKMGGGDVMVEGCVLSGGNLDGCVNLTVNSVARKVRLSNNTIYGSSVSGLSLAAGIYPALMDVELVNNVFKDCAEVIKVEPSVWPEESSTRYGTSFTMRNNCYHGYTNFATDGTDNKTYAQFTAYGRVDASGDLDATDPLLTDAGAGDFSLAAASPCRNTGHGSGVLEGQNAVAYDPNHPDIGGWSSGTLTVAAPAIASVIKLSTSSARLSLHADNVSDVLSVRYRLGWGEEWTLFGSTRTGSGTLDVTDLAFGTYTFLATAARGGEISLPSNAARVSITEDGIASPGEAVYALLRANSTLAALVGDHIYAQGAPEAAPPPYVTVVRIGGTPEHTLAASAGFAEARFQIESYGATLEDAQSVADAVRNSLDGYRGTVTVGSAEVAVGSIRRDSDSDGFTQPTSAGGIGRHRVVQDYLMTHEESVPVFP